MKTSEHESAVLEDIALTDVEVDHEPVPMSLEHSEIEMRDKDQMVCITFYFLITVWFFWK